MAVLPETTNEPSWISMFSGAGIIDGVPSGTWVRFRLHEWIKREAPHARRNANNCLKNVVLVRLMMDFVLK